MDIVCDTYFKDSLEAQTRNSRGCDQLLEFSPDTLLPKRMQEDFLRNDENKKNLNIFLAHTVLGADFGNTFVIVSLNDDILTNTTADTIDNIDELRKSCKHEEADVKIIPHVQNCK